MGGPEPLLRNLGMVQDEKGHYINDTFDFGAAEPQKEKLESERDMARDVATLKAQEYLMEKYKETKYELYREFARESKSVNEDRDGWGLRALWQSGYFRKGLDYVESETRCASLKEYIRWVRTAPLLEWKEVA